MRSLLLAGLGAIAITAAACTQEQAPAPEAAAPPAAGDEQVATPAAAGPPAVAGEIDWAAARADAAKRPADVVIPQASGDVPLTVPMLLPSGIVQTASDRPVPPKIVNDGYFATYHLPRYDVTVNGSSKAYQAGAAAPAGDKSEMKFTTVEAGASLAFSRYGADYLIDFECREVDSPEGCITEAEAKEFAESLFVAQSR
jgi:hypothetical protein